MEQYYNTITIYVTNSSIYKKGGRVSNLNVLAKCTDSSDDVTTCNHLGC